MSENIGAQAGLFNTLIPSIDENADIQTAFRLYHYGEGSSGIAPLNPNSIAGISVLNSPACAPIFSGITNYLLPS